MAAKKAAARKASAKKAGAKKTTRTYGPKASEKVEESMREMKSGELKSGRSGKTVTNPKQAIAIGLSEARHEGGKVPPPPARKRG
jgi:DNA invertase Pin-like site-specific DNA recombinase